MEHSSGMYQMSIQQDIPPAPNEDPKAVDWLPLFSGFSWLAYGADVTIVITMAPSPSNTGEAAMGGFFQQVLSTDQSKDGEEKERVTSVGWAPSGDSVGSLAAAAGKYIYLYGPKGLNSVQEVKESVQEVPLSWVNMQVLEHFSQVHSFSWSESGDGLLSVGLEIVMWQKGVDSWNCLWRTPLEQPHSLSAASWSARGIAATAEGVSSSATLRHEDDTDHVVKIWWWEDGKELQEVDLTHPDKLLMIQWRPMNGFGPSAQSFRPVLLTCCQDGVVRLWAEIGNLGFPESRNSALTNSEGTNQVVRVYESQFKLAFFVSAVIDANTTLKGILGHDIHVTWPEARGGDLSSSSSHDDGKRSLVTKGSEATLNEWLIVMGPSGSITLWSVQSLDDLSAERGPLLQLWHQRSSLLPSPSMPSLLGNVDIQSQRNLQSIKVVMHRAHGIFWGPPSSLDVFEIWSPHLLRLSCIWPPVSAMGGRNSKPVSSNSGSASAGGKMSAWGVSSEVVFLGGHHGNIRQVAVHPVARIRLVASLDNLGMILLWVSNGCSSNPRLQIPGCLNPLWKLSGQLMAHRVNCTGPFNSIAWAPVLLPGDDAVLLVANPYGVDCFLISRRVCISRGKPKSLSMSHKLLYTLDWPLSENAQGLQGIYSFTSCSTLNENHHISSCMAVGVGDSGLRLAAWKLDIEVHDDKKQCQPSCQDLEGSIRPTDLNVNIAPSKAAKVREDTVHSADPVSHGTTESMDNGGPNIMMEARLLGLMKVFTGEHITSIAVATSEHLLSSDFEQVCDVVTGCANGVVSLWKVRNGESVDALDSLQGTGGWQCVGLLRFYSGPVVKVALCSDGSKIASIGSTVQGTLEMAHIWGADICTQDKGFCLEGQLLLPSPGVSIGWLDGGNGLPILGLVTQSHVQLFAECRLPASQSGGGSRPIVCEGNVWSRLASMSLTGFTLSSLSWETQGSLIVAYGGHMLLYSNCLLPVASDLGNSDTRQPLAVAKRKSSKFMNLFSFQSLLPQGNGDSTGQNPVKALEVDNSDQEKVFCSILEAAESIGGPICDYHPASILWWISMGNRQFARASIRHLASYLSSLSGSSFLGMGVDKMILDNDSKVPKTRIPRTPLCKYFQEKEKIYPAGGQSSTSSFGLAGSTQSQGGRNPDFFSNSSRESFSDLNSAYWGENQSLVTEPKLVIKSGGFEPYTKLEVESISIVVKNNLKVPGLSSDEKLQLLALIDVVAEMDGVSQTSQIDSLDLPGQRFWLAYRYAFLHARWKRERNPDFRELVIESKAMSWALQSDCQENLVELCLSDQSVTWSALRALGVGYWFTDGAQLRKRMEKVARAQYLEKKDPKDCALLYLALDRQSVLAGLFKLSRDQRDKPLANFLLRDFKEEKNKVAALKNAYVLMGTHRHELAAGFFILGGDNNSAAVVCAKHLGDPQLALVISSLLEGVNGPIGCDMILKYALPSAREAKDVWLASSLQWLMGKGIESLQELTVQSYNQSSRSPEMLKESPEGLKVCSVFPLENDVGNYCTLLASKPRLRTGPVAAEAFAMAMTATRRSAASLRRRGLLLPALEYLKNNRSVNATKHGLQPSYDMFNSDGSCLPASVSTLPSHDFPLMDACGNEVGLCSVSGKVVGGIQRATREGLVLQCASQLLQDHPHWGGQTSTDWQDAQVPEKPFTLKEKGKNVESYGENEGGPALDRSENCSHISSFLEAADKLYNGDLQVLEREYLVNVNWVATALSTFARIHHRPYICYRLVQGSTSEVPEMGFHLASKLAVSASAAQYLETFGMEAPWVLARTVLACGGAAAALDVSQSKNRSGFAEGGALQLYQIEELVHFGGEILLLTTAANEGNSLSDKERSSRALRLLSFVFFVAAAWLGRQTRALFTLISPTVIDASRAPEIPPGEFDAVAWFRALEMEKSPLLSSLGTANGKRPLEAGGLNLAGRVTISGEDGWRVLGVSLWTHLLIYVKKQLTGTGSEASYSSFGRISSSQSQSSIKSSIQHGSSQPHPSMAPNTKGPTFLGFNIQSSTLASTLFDLKSKVRDGYHTHPYVTISSDNTGPVEGGPTMGRLPLIDGSLPDDFGAALSSSLTSIVAGLRKQLASHVHHSVNMSEQDPLALWLWGKPSRVSAKKPSGGSNTLNFFGVSSSNGVIGATSTSSVDVYSQPQPNLFPTAVIGVEDYVWKEMWELLVVREKVCSALGLEGVNGQRSKQENDKTSGWYIGRKGSGPASQIDSTGSRDVSNMSKLPPKRIMWNAVKGIPSVPDQGVTLKSRRQEENGQSRPQASGDGVHLSEEFSEVVFLTIF